MKTKIIYTYLEHAGGSWKPVSKWVFPEENVANTKTVTVGRNSIFTMLKVIIYFLTEKFASLCNLNTRIQLEYFKC